MKRLNRILIGGIIGFVFGLLLGLFVMSTWPTFKWITDLTFQPLVYLTERFVECNESCYFLYLVYPIVMAILFALIGMWLGRLVNMLKS